MKENEKKAAIERYNERLARLGPTPQALGWRSREQQALRFSMLAGLGDFDGCSVLDVGCGFADFYDYLVGHGKRVAYTGVDINPRILEVARERHPELRLLERDVLEEPFQESFDYVVESGIFNRRLSDNVGYVAQMLEAMFSVCYIGVAADMMTKYVDYEDEHLFYYSPEEMFRLAQSLTRYVVLRHNYPLYEFTLYLYRKPQATESDDGGRE